jgi:hypothetical protein
MGPPPFMPPCIIGRICIIMTGAALETAGTAIAVVATAAAKTPVAMRVLNKGEDLRKRVG